MVPITRQNKIRGGGGGEGGVWIYKESKWQGMMSTAWGFESTCVSSYLCTNLPHTRDKLH